MARRRKIVTELRRAEQKLSARRAELAEAESMYSAGPFRDLLRAPREAVNEAERDVEHLRSRVAAALTPAPNERPTP